MKAKKARKVVMERVLARLETQLGKSDSYYVSRKTWKNSNLKKLKLEITWTWKNLTLKKLKLEKTQTRKNSNS